MLSSFSIQGYRKFKEFQIEDLSRINFFVGKNNMGKTTILEAVYGWACGFNLHPFFTFSLPRGYGINQTNSYHLADIILTAMNDQEKIPFQFSFAGINDGEDIKFTHTVKPGELFKNFNRALSVSLDNNNEFIAKEHKGDIQSSNSLPFPMNTVTIAEWEIQKNDQLESKVSYRIVLPNLFFPMQKPQIMAQYIDILAHRDVMRNVQIYSALKKEGLLEIFVEELQSVFSEVKGIDMIPYPDGSQSPISIQRTNGQYLPIDSFGDGMRHWYHLIGSLLMCHDGIACVDEIDVTQHPTAQQELCHSLIKYARKFNVQLFITTHNLEFIDRLLAAWNTDDLKSEDDIRIITAKEYDNQVKTRNLSVEKALYARKNYQMELR